MFQKKKATVEEPPAGVSYEERRRREVLADIHRLEGRDGRF